MMYGSQIWSNQTDGRPLAKYLTEKTEKVQNSCLRKITGAYKRTPRVILQKETNIQPLELYTRTASLLHGINTRDKPVTREIQQHLDSLWEQLRGRYYPKSKSPRKRSVIESIRFEAEEHISQIRAELEKKSRQKGCHREAESNSGWRPKQLLRRRAFKVWKQSWLRAKGNHTSTAWNTPFEYPTLKLYDGLKKHEATALFLIRTEIIGLNAWLASIGVPGVLPHCDCGERAQTVKHILCHCPNHIGLREKMYRDAGTDKFCHLLKTQKGCRAAARMLLSTNLLAQFSDAERSCHETLIPVTVPTLI